MRLKHLTTIALVLTVLSPVLSHFPQKVVQAQTTANSTWQPIARINPQKPYEIQVVNQTSGTLEFASTTNEFSPRKLQAGASTTLKYLPVSIYLLISPIDAAFNVRYSVFTDQPNKITVKIQPLPEGRIGGGHSTVNIQANGGIYVY